MMAAKKREVQEVFFYPDVPSKPYALSKVLELLQCEKRKGMGDGTSPCFFWKDSTYRKISKEMAKKAYVINAKCQDISKSFLEKAHQKVFGYGAEIDPLVYTERYVMKMNRNAWHIGFVCRMNLPKIPGFVYQKLICNHAKGLVVDLRIPIFKRNMPLAYEKYRSMERRFSNTNRRVILSKVEDHFTKKEAAKIAELCREVGLEYGEVDVIRDAKDGKIYVIDVNPTPYGPPNGISKKEGKKAIRLMSSAFKKKFLMKIKRA